MENNSKTEPEIEDALPKNQKNTHSRTQRLIVRFFNYRAWSDWERCKSMTQYFLGVFERLLIPKKMIKNPKAASFDKVVAKLNLSEEELKVRAHGLLRLGYIMSFMAFVLFCYTGYLIVYGSLKAVLISSIEMIVALALAFRYHFWHFQIYRRKLGCSVKEWFQTSFMGGGQ